MNCFLLAEIMNIMSYDTKFQQVNSVAEFT